MNDLPQTLPQLTYLLAYDQKKRKLPHRHDRSRWAVQAAALTDLLLAGELSKDKKPAVAGRPVQDPVLASLRDEIASSKPKSWRRWVEKDAKETLSAVEDQLVRAGWLSLSEETVFFITRTKVRLRDGHLVQPLHDQLRRVVEGSEPVDRLDPRTVVLASILDSAELDTLGGTWARWKRRGRIKELRRSAGPAVDALHKVVQTHQASDGGAAHSGAVAAG